MIAGKSLNINATGDINNSGTLLGRNVLVLNANNVNNIAGTIEAKAIGINATQNISNTGGSITAQDLMQLQAGRDINVQSTTASASSSTSNGRSTAAYSRTTLDRTAGLYVTGADGQPGTLIASAGRDIRIEAGEQTEDQASGYQSKTRGFASKTTTTSRQASSQTNAIQSSLGGETIVLDAGRDIQIKGSQVIGDNSDHA